jgi:hypothetical protein
MSAWVQWLIHHRRVRRLVFPVLVSQRPHPEDDMYKLLIGLSLSFLLIGCGLQLDGSVSKQRGQIDSMASGTMNNLFDQHPGLRKKVAKAEGYGVFDASGGKFLWGTSIKNRFC